MPWTTWKNSWHLSTRMSKRLIAALEPYIGRRVRITSELLSSSSLQHGDTWAELTAVRQNRGRVWCDFDSGLSHVVCLKGLHIELEPVRGSYDMAEGRDQMEAIGTALRRYGGIQFNSDGPVEWSDFNPLPGVAPPDPEPDSSGPNLTGL